LVQQFLHAHWGKENYSYYVLMFMLCRRMFSPGGVNWYKQIVRSIYKQFFCWN
jgi:hypothetical protein